MKNIENKKRLAKSLEEITELERREIRDYVNKYGSNIYIEEWNELEEKMRRKYNLTSPIIRDALKERVIELISSGKYLELLVCEDSFMIGLAESSEDFDENRFFEGWENSYDGLLLQRHGFKHKDFVNLFNEYGQVMLGGEI